MTIRKVKLKDTYGNIIDIIENDDGFMINLKPDDKEFTILEISFTESKTNNEAHRKAVQFGMNSSKFMRNTGVNEHHFVTEVISQDDELYNSKERRTGTRSLIIGYTTKYYRKLMYRHVSATSSEVLTINGIKYRSWYLR